MSRDVFAGLKLKKSEKILNALQNPNVYNMIVIPALRGDLVAWERVIHLIPAFAGMTIPFFMIG